LSLREAVEAHRGLAVGQELAGIVLQQVIACRLLRIQSLLELVVLDQHMLLAGQQVMELTEVIQSCKASHPLGEGEVVAILEREKLEDQVAVVLSLIHRELDMLVGQLALRVRVMLEDQAQVEPIGGLEEVVGRELLGLTLHRATGLVVLEELV
jgi:hypothetical protein